jgi:hypothetical protein
MSTNRAAHRSPKKALAASISSGKAAGHKAIKESRSAYHTKSSATGAAQIDLAQLASEVAELSQRLLAVEAQLNRLRAAQLHASVDRMTSAENLAWLKLAESAFGFWDNAEDAIYDTL